MNLKGYHILVCGELHPYGRCLPNALAWELIEHMREFGALVSEMFIPFHPISEESVLTQMTAWSLFDFGSAEKQPYDLIIPTSFPSYMIQSEMKSIWYCNEFSLTLQDYGKDSPLFFRSPENEKKRYLVNRMLTDTLKTSRKLFFSSADLAERVDRYLGINAPLLLPPMIDQSDYRENNSEELLKPFQEGVLVLEPKNLEYSLLTLEQLGTLNELKRLHIIGPSSVKITVKGVAQQKYPKLPVHYIDLMNNHLWHSLLHSSLFICDCRSLHCFDPIAWTALSHNIPYFHRSPSLAEIYGDVQLSVEYTLPEPDVINALHIVLKNAINHSSSATPGQSRQNDQKNRGWTDIVHNLCQPLLEGP